jgi:hypothetical protein
VKTSRDRHRKPRHIRRPFIIAGAFIVLETVALKLRSGRVAGNVVVRCRDDHLFTTIWIPGGSLKSLRFGWWRFQRCPVGRHWSIVTPVKQIDLTEDESRIARENRDIRIP